MSRVFFDTNVWLPAVLVPGFVRRIAEAAEQQGTVFISRELVNEVVEKLALKFRTSWETIRDAEALMRKIGFIFADAVTPYEGCPDPDDAVFIAQALAARCGYFVTNDKPLLKLESIGAMRFVTPAGYARVLGIL